MRLLTRSDFDGLVCAVLLKDVGLIDRYKFVHPKDIQDGKVEVTENDVLANIPFVPGCGLWFDHHVSEQKRLADVGDFDGSFQVSPSCARVIWDFYGGHDTFGDHLDSLMEAVDKSDSGDLNTEDIERPKDWILLSYVMDPRTGLGRYKDYRISNYQLMENCVEWCRSRTPEEILAMPDVQERLARYYEQTDAFRAMVRQNAQVQGNVVILDLREQDEIYAGNRFVIYTMFPQVNISLSILWGVNKQNTVFSVGHSVTNRTSQTNVGELLLKYGGGGHRKVGTCQVPNADAERVLHELIDAMQEHD
jgi:nanoRNase/pAp phosphatase (c-di-AMP/oligoRNAs hydrolase)